MWNSAADDDKYRETDMTKDECVKLLEERGVKDGHLDGLVHDEASHRASAINNDGLASQVEYLCEHCTPQEVLNDAFGYKQGTEDLEARRQSKSMCQCGHTGGGPNSEHSTGIDKEGHGHCTVVGCKCTLFAWRGFLRMDKFPAKN